MSAHRNTRSSKTNNSKGESKAESKVESKTKIEKNVTKVDPTKLAQQNQQLEKSSQSNQSKHIHYDDELDEEFEEKLAKNLTKDELKKTADSFDDPKSLEDSEDSGVIDGPQLDPKKSSDFWKKIQKMPKKDQFEFLQKMLVDNKFNLGQNDFSSVSGDHRTDARKRLREKRAQMQNARKTKVVREIEADKRSKAFDAMMAKNTPLVPKEEGTVKEQLEKVEQLDQIDDLDSHTDIKEHSCSDPNCKQDHVKEDRKADNTPDNKPSDKPSDKTSNQKRNKKHKNRRSAMKTN